MSVNIEYFETMFGIKNNVQSLRNKVLDLAIQGKLIEQDLNDEPASELLKKIQNERDKLIKDGKSKRQKPMEQICEVEIPFEIPENWEFTKINEIAFVTKLAGFEYTEYIAPNITSVGIPLFKGKNVQSGQLVYEFESFIPKEVSDRLIRSKVNKKCLLTPYVGTIGNISIFDGNNECHLGPNVGKIEFFNDDRKYLLEEYALYYFRSNYGNFQLKKHKKSTAQESISIEAIRDCIIPVPPINEQYRIVTKIESLMFEIDKLEEALQKKEYIMEILPKAIVETIVSCKTGEELKEQLQLAIENFEIVFQTHKSMQELRNVVLQLAIEGKLVPQDATDESASELLKRIQVEKDKLVKEGKIKKQLALELIEESDIPFEISKSWVFTRLNNVVDVRDGTHDTPKYVSEGGYPLITGKDFYNGYLSFEKTQYISEEDYLKIIQRSKVDKFDILFSMIGGNIGSMVMIDEDIEIAIKNVALFKYYCSDLILPQYLFYYLKASVKRIKSNVDGGAQPFVSLSKLRNLIIPIPPQIEQHRIVQKVESIMTLIDQMEVELKRKVDLVKKMASV